MTFKIKGRFSDAKQDQIEQLVSYATMLGLNGSDLVAIGGKMNREAANINKKANMDIISGFVCLPIGKDGSDKINDRFKLKTPSGAYNFTNGSWYDQWDIHSLKTGVTHGWTIDAYEYDLSRSYSYKEKSRFSLLLDISKGKINLNF